VSLALKWYILQEDRDRALKVRSSTTHRNWSFRRRSQDGTVMCDGETHRHTQTLPQREPIRPLVSRTRWGA